MKRQAFSAAIGGASAAVLLALTPAPAVAQVASFHIPAAPLSTALNAYARATNRQLTFSHDVVQRYRTSPLEGSFTPDEALTRLLRGTGLVVV